MSNKERLEQNNSDLEAIKEQLEALPEYQDVSGTNAKANDILSPKVAFANGQKVIGSITTQWDATGVADYKIKDSAVKIYEDGEELLPAYINIVNYDYDSGYLFITYGDTLADGRYILLCRM